jgi:hypothetical protein
VQLQSRFHGFGSARDRQLQPAGVTATPDSLDLSLIGVTSHPSSTQSAGPSSGVKAKIMVESLDRLFGCPAILGKFTCQLRMTNAGTLNFTDEDEISSAQRE